MGTYLTIDKKYFKNRFYESIEGLIFPQFEMGRIEREIVIPTKNDYFFTKNTIFIKIDKRKKFILRTKNENVKIISSRENLLYYINVYEERL